MHKLAQLLAERLSSGLKRKAVTNCAKWCETYRVMGQPFPGAWNWKHHPWLYEMHLAEGEKLVGQKSAQMGFTEWALNKTFYSMDILGLSVLYVLPSNDDASDFSAARFDKALENSSYLANFFSEVKNVGHKRAGNTSLYVRGSRSRSKLKSIDTAIIVFDEMDEMVQENITLAQERQSGQRIETQQNLYVSTPTIDNFGINAIYRRTTQEHFHFKCPHCSRFIEFKFPESMVITAESEADPRIKESHYICFECKHKLDEKAKPTFLLPKDLGGSAIYVPTNNASDRGFHVNQMYSTTIAPSKFAESYLLGLKDPTSETEFNNSKLGKTHAVQGSKVTEDDIMRCMQNYNKGNAPKNGFRTMGIDVGSVCHVTIEEWILPRQKTPGLIINDESIPKVIWEGKTSGNMNDFTELDKLFQEYSINGCIIDAEPERRVALQFAHRHHGAVLLCDFMFSQKGRSVTIAEEECTMQVNRTSWFDLALSRFRTKRIILPQNVSKEYRDHVCEPQRVYKKDRWGNPFGCYESVGADHFALSRIYSEIALIVACVGTKNTDVQNVY